MVQSVVAKNNIHVYESSRTAAVINWASMDSQPESRMSRRQKQGQAQIGLLTRREGHEVIGAAAAKTTRGRKSLKYGEKKARKRKVNL